MKRIAASLFLEFLDKNDALIRDGQKVISDGALVAITLMIAESNPEEKRYHDNIGYEFIEDVGKFHGNTKGREINRNVVIYIGFRLNL